jgi:AcrR family transcriptional regulator
MSTSAAFQRARRPEQKQQREDAILGAARELALRDGVRNVSLNDIAARIGIHKSALLRYFETREQIFLELTAASWRDWVQALHADLDGAADGAAAGAVADGAAGGAAAGAVADGAAGGSAAGAVADGAADGSAGQVADVVARSFADRPLLCDLIPHTALNLERNVSPAAVRRYKLTSLGAISDAAGLVHRVLPELTEGECREFISAMASLAGALWQIANPPPMLAELYATDPDLGHACVDLLPRLRRTAAILLAGLIPSRPSGGASF